MAEYVDIVFQFAFVSHRLFTVFDVVVLCTDPWKEREPEIVWNKQRGTGNVKIYPDKWEGWYIMQTLAFKGHMQPFAFRELQTAASGLYILRQSQYWQSLPDAVVLLILEHVLPEHDFLLDPETLRARRCKLLKRIHTAEALYRRNRLPRRDTPFPAIADRMIME